ncbi:MAG: c-type cytochrome [Saprospiraceae bacterium]|nr:c-type cytochrome [Saprospiraceae bacterium]
MKKILKWVGTILGLLLVMAAGTAFYLNSSAKSRLAKKYDIQPKSIAIPTDSASIAAGQKWVSVLCTNCHGENLAGTSFFDSPDLGTICAPNLTPGGLGKTYSDLDWDRAIRHGVGNDRRPLLIMPAKDFQHMNDEHIGQIIAYLKTLHPVEQAWGSPQTTFMCNILFQLGAFGDALNAETIDHRSPSHTAPQRGVTAEYGHYMVKASGCTSCHGPQLNGGKDPNPEAPMGPNLTPGGSLATWGADGFVQTMHTGVTPMGKEINGKFMPWKEVGHYDNDQLQAIYAYLMSLPKLEMAEIEH